MSADTQRYYPTDLTDRQWAWIEPLLPETKSGPGQRGRPLSDRRQIVNEVL